MHTTTLAVTLAMAVIYLLAVRLIDFNEKEPLWAVVMLFAFGAVAAVGLMLGVDSAFLELNVIPGVMAKELARFVAIGGGVAVLTAHGRSRGYSEINGLMDGVVYGASGGLGFATGLALAREVLLPSANLPLVTTAAASYGEVALVGLSDGVFGALIGIGFAAMLDARTQLQRAVGPLGGYLAAALGHFCYAYIGKADPFGDAALLRKWIALLLPVVVVVAVAIVALARERRAITEELESEAETGAVTAADLRVLCSLVMREALYFKALARVDFGGWSALHGLHNRQVQLALAKRRTAREKDDERRAQTAGEVARLRKAVLELKRRLGIEPPPSAEPASEEGGNAVAADDAPPADRRQERGGASKPGAED